jgi:uncharacterized membrane protein
MNNLTTILLNLVIFSFLIGIEVIMPKLTRKDIVFSVRVPIDILDDERIKTISEEYRKKILRATVPIALIISFLVNGDTNPAIYVSGIFTVIGLSIFYFLKSRKTIKTLKENEQWTFEKRQVTIVETKKEENSILTRIAFIIGGLIVLANGIYAKLNYSGFPNRIPYHWDLKGVATQSIPKTSLSIFLIPAIQTFLLVIMYFSYKSIYLSKVQLDVEDPKQSKIRNRIFKTRWKTAIISMLFILMSLFSLYNFELGGGIEISSVTYKYIHILVIVLIFLIVGITATKTGQGGSRLKDKTVEKVQEMNRDDDKYWKFGLIYFNKEDPSIFIEKRFGVGFTMNFANPIAVILIVALLLLIGVFSVLPNILS